MMRHHFTLQPNFAQRAREDKLDELTANDKSTICNKLAWTDGSLDDSVIDEYGLDWELLDMIMALFDYQWNYKVDLWASTREIWHGWNGQLPNDN